MATVPLVNLLNALLQKAYHDLNVLQELLRNKSDGDRKVEIVKYAQQTRALLIRLLALVKWAGNSNSVQKCSEMSVMLSQQSGLYVNTADQLVQLVRSTLVNACAPNFSLAPALDVLTTGSYPRLPASIKERVIPLSPLKEQEQQQAFSLINCTIRRRLLKERVPERMKAVFIGDGVIRFQVAHEFELTLSLLSEDMQVPWRLISLRILVGEGLQDRPVLLHHHQKLFLHQLLQSRLYSEDTPLDDCYQCLHSFCLSLQLDCLHHQANQLSASVYGGYIKVEEYGHAHHLKMVYWRPSAAQTMGSYLMDQSRAVLSPRILVSIDPSRGNQPFSTHHSPPLPPGSPEIGVSAANLSLETLLKDSIRIRSHSLLKAIIGALKTTPWEDKAELQEVPLCLRVQVPLKYGTRCVVLGVDPRVGNVVAVMEPRLAVGRIQQHLEELEKAVTASHGNLPAQLSKLQCHLFVVHVSEMAKELNLPVHWSLPLVQPLPFHSLSLVSLELRPLTFLVVSVVEEGFLDQYHLLTLSPAYLGNPAPPSSSSETPSPKLFFTISSLVELNPEEISLQHLRMVRVTKSGPLLKRKLMESSLALPSIKRMCLRGRPQFSSTPGHITSRMVLLSMETSLNAAGIGHHTISTEFGSPLANIFCFPPPRDTPSGMHQLLSSSLKSCLITHSNNSYTCTFVFVPFDLAGQTGESRSAVLKQCVAGPHPSNSSNSSNSSGGGGGQDGGGGRGLGQTLLGQWQARVMLLGLTLELQQYLDDVHWPLHTCCAISEFTYDQLVFSFGRHQLHVKATPTGLSLSFSEECPHTLVKDSLEAFLSETRSLPLLLQGVSVTEATIGTLSEFVRRVEVVSVTAATPSLLQFTYDNSFVLGLSLLAYSTVAFTDIKYIKPTFPNFQLNPLSYFQAFLGSALSESSMDTEEAGGEKTSTAATTAATSTTTAAAPPTSTALPTMTPKPPLYPTPSPISFPRRTSYPDSVPPLHGFSIPSIPPFPSPAVGTGMGPGGSSSGWNWHLSLEQFNQLLSATPSRPVQQDCCVVGCSLLWSFLGSMTLLFHGLTLALKHQMAFVRCDHGTYTYRNDNNAIVLALGIEGAVARATVAASRENVWSSAELNALMELFKRDVMCAPFSVHGVTSFLTLLNLPLHVLKNCLQLLLYQQNPQTGMVWQYSVCVTIPQGADLTGTPFLKGGAAIIYGRQKLLLFLRLERIQDKKSFILPLMYDPKTNLAYVARFQNQYRNAQHPIIDNILKKASGEVASGQMGHPMQFSLYSAVRSLAQTTLSI